jgi:hypothetical protein
MAGFGPIVGVDGFPLSLGGLAPVHVAALDGLSAPAKASLRAFWWTRQKLATFTGLPYDATHLYDQSGAGKNLLSGAPVGTTFEGSDIALVLDPLVPNTFARGDALGLAADPALTIVWKMKCTADLSTFPTLLSMGTSGDPEMSVSFETGALDTGNFEGSASLQWSALTGLDVWNTWVMTKPVGGGYANTWRLYRGATAIGAPDLVTAGALALGNTSLILGDFDGGGFPFGGHLAGMGVFERELSGADLALVQAL